jgi:hypothetical protein
MFLFFGNKNPLSTNISIRINIAAPKPAEDWLFTKNLKNLKDDL